MTDMAMDQQQVTTRPRTPVPTLWFEFLLDASLLPKHLAQENPEPTATQLLVQFVDQSIKTQGEEESEQQKRKAASLKSLALQVAAHLNWNITRLQKDMPLFMVHKVLKDFVESVSPPNLNIQPGTDVCSLSDSVLIALAVYNRWCIRTLLDSAHSSRPSKTVVTVLPNGSNLNVAGINDMVIKTVKDTLQESVSFLERCLPINRNISVPAMQTFQEAPPTKVPETPPTDTPPTNGNAESDAPSTNQKTDPKDPLPVLTKEQFLCLLCYDLGSFYFHQRIIPRAAEMFSRVALLLPLLSGSVYSDIDPSTLQGYLAACGGGQREWPTPQEIPRGHMLQQIEKSRQTGLNGILELLEEDNRRLETAMSYRDHLLNLVLSSQPSVGSQTVFQVLALHVIRRFKEGLTVVPQHLSILRGATDKNLEALGVHLKREFQQQQKKHRTNTKALLRSLCTDDRISKCLCQSLKDTLTNDELLALCQKVITQEAVAMEIGSTSQTDNMALQLGNLEQRLLLTNSHSELDSILTQLHRLGPGKRYSNICSKWQIEKSYAFILDGMGNKKTHDMLFLLLVKAQHCTEIKNYTAAKSLLETAHALVHDTSFKLQKALLHEILCIELLSGVAGSLQVEPGKPTVPQRIQSCLASAKSERDITPRDTILDQCIIHLLNSGNWVDAMAADFIGTPYSMLGKVIATACHDLSVRKDASKSSVCLWNATLQIFSSSNKQVKRSSSGKPAGTVQRESMLAIMLRSDFLHFLKQLRSSLCLSVMLSCVVRLYNILKDDSTNELSHEHSQLWPTTITNVSSINVDSVAMAMGQLISHVISVNPGQSSWLRTQADYHFANGQYASALQFYLQSASVITGLFEVPVPRDVWSDLVYRRLIKCCNHLQCYTQVALLCQLLQPVDYTTAFKALQEKSCYDAGDALYDCIWDVTLLEYLIYLHNKRNEQEKKQKAVQALSAAELNTSNPENILSAAAQKRACRFLRAMAKQYL